MSDLRKILDGMTGEEVANIIYNNDNILKTEVSQTKTSLENSLDSIVDSKLSGMNLDDKIDQSVNNRLSKPLTISLSETKAGTYSIGGETLDIYEKSIRLLSLPRTVGDTKEYIVSEEPLGFGTYLNIESFVASTGKGLDKEFFNFNYEITRFYINSSMQSCIVIRCKTTVSENVNGLLHIQYCKFFGDVIEFDITVPNSINKENISLEIPPLKYNKKMAFSYITDDSYSIYQYIFSVINKRLTMRKFGTEAGATYNWHLGMEGKSKYDQYMLTEPYRNENFLQCTDGAGIKHRYATTVSCWGDKLKDQTIGQDVDMYWPWMSEKEFKFYFDFGFMCAYHDLIGYDKDNINTQEEFDKCVNDTASLFKEYVGIVPKLMVEPNGDHKYITFSKENSTIQVITAQSGDSSIKLVYPFKPGYTLDKNDVTIQRIFAYGSDLNNDNDNPGYSQDLLNRLSQFNSSSDKSSIYWLIGSAHRGSHWESALINNIHKLYGDIGNDSLWFPTLEEMYEYWYMKMNTVSIKTITDTGVHYKMYVPKGANFFFRDMSVLISGISNINGVSVRSSDNVYGTSYAMNDGKLLVNLDFNKSLIEKAEKYLSIFEADHLADYNYDNALYFIQKLKDGVRESYETRLNKYSSPPTLDSVIINNGDATTKNKVVSIKITYSGTGATHYMVSENSDFSGASWIAYSSEFSYTLSDGFDEKTVYVKLKNPYGDSSVMSSKITYEEPDLVLNSIVLNNGDSTTSNRSIKVKFNYTGFPTHYMISESPSFAGGTWIAYSSNDIDFQLSEGYSSKTIYAKMKGNLNESSSKSSTIELVDTTTAILNSIVINNGNEYSDSSTVSVKLNITNEATKYKIGKKSNLSDCPDWITLSGTTVSYTSGVTNGTLTLYAKVANDVSESDIKSDDIIIMLPVEITGLTIANGAESFEGKTVPVSFTISEGVPDKYRLSESELTNDDEYIDWSDNITYKFSSAGSKTLYGQVSNPMSESSIVSSSIEILEGAISAILGFNGTKNNTVDYNEINGEVFNQIAPSDYASYSSYKLKSVSGDTLPWYVNLNTSKYPKTDVFIEKGFGCFVGNSTATDGEYPVSQFLQCLKAKGKSGDGFVKLRVSLTLPKGSYNIKILYSPESANLIDNTFRPICHYGIYQGDTRIASAGVSPNDDTFTGAGNNTWNSELNFSLSETSDISVSGYLEGDGIPQYAGSRPGFNLLKITKLS